MINTSILQNMSSLKSKAMAMADYWHGINEKYSTVVQFLASIYTLEYEDQHPLIVRTGQNSFTLSDYAIQYWKENVSFLELEATCSMPFGYITWSDVYLAIAVSDYFLDADVPPGEFTIPVYDSTGAKIKEVSSATIDWASQLFANLQSGIAMEAAAASAWIENVTEKITSFRDKISTWLKSAYSDATGAIAYYADLLKNSSPSTCLDQLINATQVEQVASGEVSTLQDTELSHFTGANPVAVVDLSGVGKVLGATGQAIAAGAVAIFNGIKNLFSFVGRSVAKVVTQTFVNPVDLYEANTADDAQPSIDAWVFQKIEDAGSMTLDDEVEAQQIYAWLQTKTQVPFKLDLLFGEIVYKMTEVSLDGKTIEFKKATLQIKPYCLDVNVVYDLAIQNGISVLHKDGGTYLRSLDQNSMEYASFLAAMSVSPIYAKCKEGDENHLYEGFVLAYQLMALCIRLCYCDTMGYSYSELDFAFVPDASNVTNADFVTIASGWDQDSSSPSFNEDPFDGPAGWSAWYVLRMLSFIIAKHSVDRNDNPLNYSFLPYRENVSDFSPSRYAIKTDAENSAAATKFLTIAVIVAVAVVVTTTAVVGIKKLMNSTYFKHTQRKFALEQKMYNREPLTARERRQYLRSSRRLEKMSWMTGPLQSVSSEQSSSNERSLQDESLMQIIALIRG